jgi:hypothetical protein
MEELENQNMKCVFHQAALRNDVTRNFDVGFPIAIVLAE